MTRRLALPRTARRGLPLIHIAAGFRLLIHRHPIRRGRGVQVHAFISETTKNQERPTVATCMIDKAHQHLARAWARLDRAEALARQAAHGEAEPSLWLLAANSILAPATPWRPSTRPPPKRTPSTRWSTATAGSLFGLQPVSLRASRPATNLPGCRWPWSTWPRPNTKPAGGSSYGHPYR